MKQLYIANADESEFDTSTCLINSQKSDRPRLLRARSARGTAPRLQNLRFKTQWDNGRGKSVILF